MERQDLSCTYLAQLELESAIIVYYCFYGLSLTPRLQSWQASLQQDNTFSVLVLSEQRFCCNQYIST